MEYYFHAVCTVNRLYREKGGRLWFRFNLTKVHNQGSMTIYDFEDCSLSFKDGSYGGAAGDKIGIVFKDAEWLLKFPKNIKGMDRTGDLSYSTSPLSEYIGSHIFGILGMDVHETELGIRNGKLAVACKDFATKDDLREIRTIKNRENEELSERFGYNLEATGDQHIVDLENLLVHIEHNHILSKITDVEQRFWEQAVIDIYINNNDRNNGNWGIIRSREFPDKLAPVFDNGGCLQTKISENKAEQVLGNIELAKKNAINTQTAYGINGHILSSKRFLDLQEEYEKLSEAIIRLTPLIKQKEPEVELLLNNLPSMVFLKNGQAIEVIGDHKRKLFKLQLHERLEQLLEPAYERALELQEDRKHVSVEVILDRIKDQSIGNEYQALPKRNTEWEH